MSRLGDELLLRIEAALEAIRHDPYLCGCIHGDVRRKLTRRFPYGVFYIVSEDRISVSAVMHAKRHPGRRQSRV